MGSFREITTPVLLVGLTLAAAGCPKQDYSPPRATIETAQDALRENDAERHFESLSEDLRRKRLDRWRSRIGGTSATDLDGSDAENTTGRMSGPDVLARYLKELRQSRWANERPKQYAKTDFSAKRRSDTAAVLKVKSWFPLPYERGHLRKIDGLWKIGGIE